MDFKKDLKKELGITIKQRRMKLGLSQEALAELADLHRTYVTDIESGTRNLTLESIAKLATALGTTISELFAPDPPAAQPAKLAPASTAVDLLLAEDHESDAELALTAFKQANFTNNVHRVKDGISALDFIFCKGEYRSRIMELPPQAVLLCLNLPKIPGLEVLRRVKENERARNIKIIMLATSRQDDRIQEAIRLGAAGYIVKPVDFQNFSLITPKLDFCWTLFKPDGLADSARTIGRRHT